MEVFFGAQIPGNSTTFEEMKAVAQTMDRGLWHSAWTYDHFLPPEAFLDENDPSLEGWATLTGLAVLTDRVRWGCLVTGNTYRNPALLAHMAATVDQMTGGRLEFGIGAAWHEREHRAYGWDFPSLRERSDRLEEACALIKTLFTAEGPVDFHGKYYRLDRAPFAPRCLQQPHAPIMVGGGGEKRTLRTLARYGDVMNVSGTPEIVRHKIEVLERHCAEVDRDPTAITRTIFLPVALQDDPDKAAHLRSIWGPGLGLAEEERERYLAIGSADHLIDVFRQYQQVGVQGIIFQGIPNRPRLYERLNEEVLTSFA
jgi:F420-dependent oxidoreductase-like protein